ncbi:MAG: MBL fold metallo-hydrolase [bacterium]|nr:MBL fold metallo-hydrolase [bacterium]
MITIEYLGQSSFKISNGETKIIIDPFEPKATNLKWSMQEADTVLVSHNHADHNYIAGVKGFEKAKLSSGKVGDKQFLVYGSGEYEVNGVQIMGLSSFHDNKKGAERGENTIFIIHIEDFVIAHLGDIGHDLTEAQYEEVSNANILMIPVGGFYTIDHDIAEKIVANVEPNIIIPMHYKAERTDEIGKNLDEVDKFLTSVSAEDIINDDKLKLKTSTSLDQDKTVVWVKAQ